MNTKYNCDLQTVLLKTLSAQKRLDRERLYTALDDLLIDISPVIMFLSLFFHLAPSSGNTRRLQMMGEQKIQTKLISLKSTSTEIYFSSPKNFFSLL